MLADGISTVDSRLPRPYNRSECPDSTGQRHIPNAEGRVGSVDNGIFIHAIASRHVECVTLMTRKEAD